MGCWQFNLWLLFEIQLVSVHVLLKHSLKDFEHYLPSMGKECNYTVVNILWHCLSLGLE